MAEIARYGEEMAGRNVTSVFFGGGTPSLLPPADIARLIVGYDFLVLVALAGMVAHKLWF